MMDTFFPGGGWLRVSRSTLDALSAYKTARALPTWEHAITALLQDVSLPSDVTP
jgi:hypothetical protein